MRVCAASPPTGFVKAWTFYDSLVFHSLINQLESSVGCCVPGLSDVSSLGQTPLWCLQSPDLTADSGRLRRHKNPRLLYISNIFWLGGILSWCLSLQMHQNKNDEFWRVCSSNIKLNCHSDKKGLVWVLNEKYENLFRINQLVTNIIPYAWGENTGSSLPERFQFGGELVLKLVFQLSLQQTLQRTPAPGRRQASRTWRGGLPNKTSVRKRQNSNIKWWCLFYYQSWYQRWCVLYFFLTGTHA